MKSYYYSKFRQLYLLQFQFARWGNNWRLSRNFMDWAKTQLVLNLLITLQLRTIAQYCKIYRHQFQFQKGRSNKMAGRKIKPVPQQLLKPKLCASKRYKPYKARDKTFKLDSLMKSHGHMLLCQPPCQPELAKSY